MELCSLGHHCKRGPRCELGTDGPPVSTQCWFPTDHGPGGARAARLPLPDALPVVGEPRATGSGRHDDDIAIWVSDEVWAASTFRCVSGYRYRPKPWLNVGALAEREVGPDPADAGW
jgi:hypothetical protein